MELVITEKPSVAKSISRALNIPDNSSKQSPFIEGGGYIITWCLGHLVELATPDVYDSRYEKWRYDDLPIIPDPWRYEIKTKTKKQFNVIRDLIKRADVTGLIEATDSGREGELIFRLVYRKAGCKKPFKRLWISSLEDNAIREGFTNLYPSERFDPLMASALCRQKADWLVGINGTRLFTVVYQGKKPLKVGRVQTPTLSMIVDRDMEIALFKKEAYYTVHLLMDGLNAATKKFEKKDEADLAEVRCKSSPAKVVKITEEEKSQNPPQLYDLTSLQRDANRIYGFTAKQTLEFTQSLYEKRFVTYPRTDSKYVTEDMGSSVREIINAVFKSYFLEDASGYSPNIGRITDNSKVSDHHAIIPTMEITRQDVNGLKDGEKKIYSLIALRLITATARKHIYKSVKVEITCGGYLFTATGKSVLEEGFKSFEKRFRGFTGMPASDEENELTNLTEGQELSGFKTEVREGFTSPKPHFTEDTLLKAMERAGADEMSDDVERKGLGTPATRADIIEKLVKDGFVVREKKKLISTDDGKRLITILPENLKNPQMTAEWENVLARIAKGEENYNNFLGGIEKMMNEMVETYNGITNENPFEQDTIGTCPRCGKPIYYGKYGAYCSGKCGLRLSNAFGKRLTKDEVMGILRKERTLVRNLVSSKSGKEYAAYLTYQGIEEFSYTSKNDGSVLRGYQIKYGMEFPERN